MPIFSFTVNGLGGVLKWGEEKRLKTFPATLDRSSVSLIIHRFRRYIINTFLENGVFLCL